MKNLLPLLLLVCFASCRKDLQTITGPSTQSNAITDRYITRDDFRQSKFRGWNGSYVGTLAELKAKDLPGARITGANHLRYWVRVNHDATGRYYFTSPDQLTTLDSAVRQAEKLGLYLIVTLDVLPNQIDCDLWGHPERQDGVIKIWTDSLVPRLKDKKIVAAYDLINEPRLGTVKEYIDWQVKMITAIQAVDPNHVIVVENLQNEMWADPYCTKLLTLKNWIMSPHGYNTLRRKYPDGTGGAGSNNVTHQGVPPKTVRYAYPSYDYPSGLFSSNSYWYIPNNFAKKYNIPVWVGEFSCINWAPKNSAGQWTSTRWIEDAIIQMEKWGWSWAEHAWNEYQGWDPRIPSSFYVGMNYVDAAPYPKPTYWEWKAAKTDTAPTIVMTKKYLAKNTAF